MWRPLVPAKPYNAACGDCGTPAEVAGGMRRGLCLVHYKKRLRLGTLPPVEPFPPSKPRRNFAKRFPSPGNTIDARARREKRRRIAAARLARVGLPLRVEPGEMPRPIMPNNSRAWVRGESTKLT